MNFQIKGVDPQFIQSLFQGGSQAIAPANAKWIIAETSPGYPCRVSLQEADKGERVLLVHFQHHNTDSPYQASGPIFIRENAKPTKLAMNEVPKHWEKRLLSLRGYQCNGDMVQAQSCEGSTLKASILQMFEHQEVSYIHVHNARPGCFACYVERA